MYQTGIPGFAWKFIVSYGQFSKYLKHKKSLEQNSVNFLALRTWVTGISAAT